MAICPAPATSLPSGKVALNVIRRPASPGGMVNMATNLPLPSAVAEATSAPSAINEITAPGAACPAISAAPSGSIRVTSMVGAKGAAVSTVATAGASAASTAGASAISAGASAVTSAPAAGSVVPAAGAVPSAPLARVAGSGWFARHSPYPPPPSSNATTATAVALAPALISDQLAIQLPPTSALSGARPVPGPCFACSRNPDISAKCNSFSPQTRPSPPFPR